MILFEKKQIQIQKIVLILKDYKKTAKHSNENVSCYEVGLPFKEFNEILNDNCFNFKKRFNSLNKKI